MREEMEWRKSDLEACLACEVRRRRERHWKEEEGECESERARARRLSYMSVEQKEAIIAVKWKRVREKEWKSKWIHRSFERRADELPGLSLVARN